MSGPLSFPGQVKLDGAKMSAMTMGIPTSQKDVGKFQVITENDAMTDLPLWIHPAFDHGTTFGVETALTGYLALTMFGIVDRDPQQEKSENVTRQNSNKFRIILDYKDFFGN